uniref:KTI12 n=1 Tax=Panagrolaimus sp. JU765 TaxID=591449 RepID=A0AC34RJ92_9BILA
MKVRTGLYTSDKIEELAQRYEVPNPDNRWDSPLVKVDISHVEGRLPRDVELNFDHIFDLLFNGEKAKPNDCTVAKVEHNTNKLNEMQVITQQIIQAILEKQSMNFGSDRIQVPHSTIPYVCKKNRNMPQLTRAKAQFMQVLKGNEAIGTDSVGNHFVDFLNTL